MNKVKVNYSLLAIIFILLLSYSMQKISVATEYGAHTHGKAELTLVVESDLLHMQFIAPAESLIGFEHPVITSEELLRLSTVEQQLSVPKVLFNFQGSNCKLDKFHVDTSSLSLTNQQTVNKKHNHSSRHHDENNNAHKKHTEITADYTYRCEKIKDLSTFTVELFQYFQAIEEINVRWVLPHKQGANLLTPTNKHISFP